MTRAGKKLIAATHPQERGACCSYPSILKCYDDRWRLFMARRIASIRQQLKKLNPAQRPQPYHFRALSTPVQKFANVFLQRSQAASRWVAGHRESIAAKSLRVNFHSKGFAVASQ